MQRLLRVGRRERELASEHAQFNCRISENLFEWKIFSSLSRSSQIHFSLFVLFVA